MFDIDRLIDEPTNSFYNEKKDFLEKLEKGIWFHFVYISVADSSSMDALVKSIYHNIFRSEWEGSSMDGIFFHPYVYQSVFPLKLKFKISALGFILLEKEIILHEVGVIHDLTDRYDFIEEDTRKFMNLLYFFLGPLVYCKVSLDKGNIDKILMSHIPEKVLQRIHKALGYKNPPTWRDLSNKYEVKSNDLYDLPFPKTHQISIKKNIFGGLTLRFLELLVYIVLLVPLKLAVKTYRYFKGPQDNFEDNV